MAETKHQEAAPLSAKRKPDLACDDNPSKTPKLETPPDNNIDSHETDSKFEADLLAEAEDEDDDNEDDYEDEEEDEDDDEAGENGNGKAEVDRKGKGIVRKDKGKGKLIVEDEADDDDDDNGDSDISNGESDLSDDPLAEVDLDNILPSRTRRRAVQPGVYIANDLDNNDDDSDDSDA